MPRMKILNMTEQVSFDKPPLFNSAERKKFFDIPIDLQNTIHNLQKSTYKIGCFLACGYFRATKKFFQPENSHTQDIEYVCRKLSIQSQEFLPKKYPRSRIHNHRQFVLNHYGYRRFDKDAENYIKQEVSNMVRVQFKPKLIFWRCVDLLTKNYIQVPNYNQLSKIILSELNERKKELTAIIDRGLSQTARSVLDGLLEGEHYLSADENARYSRYKLTLLKKLSQSTKPYKVKERADDLLYLQELYRNLDAILPMLSLGHEGIRYYANSVIKSDIFHLSRRADEDRYVHLIAFIAHQYYHLQDNLADVLLTVMQSYKNSTTREHRDWCYENNKQRNLSVKSLLDNDIFTTFASIRNVLNEAITDAQKIVQIQKLLPQKAIDESEKLKTTLDTSLNDKSYYEILENRSIRLQNRINPIVKVLDFQGEAGTEPLMEAIAYFKDKNGNITKQAPVEFLNSQQQDAINTGGTFHISLYKVFLFTHIASDLKSGTLNLKHSFKYRTLDDYMISKERWIKDKDALIEQAGLKEFVDPEPILNTLDDALYQQYKTTNKSYLHGGNPHLKIKDNGKFTIATPKQEEQENTTLQSFFPEQPVPLTEILSTVNKHTGFLEEFEHWQQRYTKNSATDKALYAGIIGKGCAIGTPKIARISSQINENNLSHVINWYFSLENIRSANDRVITLLDSMELPEIYRQSKEALHTASDGQKFTVRTDSLNANYSFKYCGKDQGASAYTFVDERHLLWYSLVFSAAERESAYVIDGLMRNDVVKSDIHSTDTHGYSEAIFATTHLLGFSYAPRIKNLKKQTLYIFKSRKGTDKSKWNIKPDKYINRDIIEETWDDILRLSATIKLKEATASEIFHRLNSFSKQHRLYHGLKAFGQIIKTDFILRYIDNVELRQAIEKMLNKVELANRFTRAVAVGDPRGFSQEEKEEQEISESCNRLIKNVIIGWNYLYLSDKLERLDKHPEQKEILLSYIASHSVMSWAHINLLGEYDFSDEKLQDSFNIRPPKLMA